MCSAARALSAHGLAGNARLVYIKGKDIERGQGRVSRKAQISRRQDYGGYSFQIAYKANTYLAFA